MKFLCTSLITFSHLPLCLIASLCILCSRCLRDKDLIFPLGSCGPLHGALNTSGAQVKVGQAIRHCILSQLVLGLRGGTEPVKDSVESS